MRSIVYAGRAVCLVSLFAEPASLGVIGLIVGAFIWGYGEDLK